VVVGTGLGLRHQASINSQGMVESFLQQGQAPQSMLTNPILDWIETREALLRLLDGRVLPHGERRLHFHFRVR